MFNRKGIKIIEKQCQCYAPTSWREGRHSTVAIRSAADHFVLKCTRTQTPRCSASSQLQFKSTGCTDAGSWLLSVAVSCGRKRSCCAGGYLFLRPSPDRPYLRTKDLLLTSQTTNKRPPAHLPSLFGASRPSILSNWTPTTFGLDQLSGGNGRSQWPKKSCIARIRGRPLGSDPELNRAEVQSEHHISKTALSGGLPRLASALYHQSTRNIFALLFLLLLPKMALFVFIFAVSSSVVRLVAGKNAMEILHKSQRIFNRRFWRPPAGAPAFLSKASQQPTSKQLLIYMAHCT